jgi:hypothetical protein
MTAIDRVLSHPSTPTVIRAAGVVALVVSAGIISGILLGWMSPWLLVHGLGSGLGGAAALLAAHGWDRAGAPTSTIGRAAMLTRFYNSRDLAMALATIEALERGRLADALVGVAKLSARRLQE